MGSGQCCAYLIGISAHLFDQGLDGVELLHATKAFDEIDRYMLAVEVAVAVEHECLHRARATRERWIRPYRYRRAMSLARRSV